MQKITPLPLISDQDLTQLVEQKRGFHLDVCALQIYETRKTITDFPLSFDGFTITSMLRGVKRVRFSDSIDRDYLPGNTIITPSYYNIEIDFPEASLEDPTQCSALTIDNTFVKKQIHQFNEVLHESAFIKSWRILDHSVLLNNNLDLVALLEKINRVAAATDPFKEIHIQLLLKELVLCVFKLQNLNILSQEATHNTNNTPFAAIINFVRQNIFREIQIEDLLKISTMSKSSFYRAFVNELGITPYQMIIDERLKIAKKLMINDQLSVKETAYAVGFSSPNYFIRLFKKHIGMTPRQYMKNQVGT